MSITDDAARKIYELTKVSGGTVPGWIREATMERLTGLGFNGSKEKKRKGRRRQSSQSEARAGGNVPGGGES